MARDELAWFRALRQGWPKSENQALQYLTWQLIRRQRCLPQQAIRHAEQLDDMMPLTFPAIPGSDPAGMVDKVAEGVRFAAHHFGG